MGCDMHCVIEAHNKKTGNWDCFGVSTANRNYTMFSKIADVRNSEKEESYIEPIAQLRGMPIDATEVAEAWFDYQELNSSTTWLDRTELESLDKWLQENHQCELWGMLGLDDLKIFFDTKNGWKKAVFTRYDGLRGIFCFSY